MTDTTSPQSTTATTLEGEARIPVLFLHGLWVHAESWKPWLAKFRAAGYEPQAPDWTGDSSTAAATRSHPEALLGLGIEEIADGYRKIIDTLPSKPILVGHSMGGLLAQKLLGEGRARAVVALSPGQIKGVRGLPLAQLRAGFPVLSNPRNRDRTVATTAAQFRYAFANAVSADESTELWEKFAIPAPGRPVFQLALADLIKNAPTDIDTTRTDRGPLLIVGAGEDRSAPASLARKAYNLQAQTPGVTDYDYFPDRGHSFVFDSGWEEVADRTLAWLAKQNIGVTTPGTALRKPRIAA